MSLMRFRALWGFLCLSCFASPAFQVKFAPGARSEAADGRLILIISKSLDGEPRFQVQMGLSTQQIFGMDVDAWKPGAVARIDGGAAGYPLPTLSELPPDTYNVQAVLNVYDTFHRADGHVLKLHMDHGEGQEWSRSPGNLYSKPQRVEIGADTVTPIELTEMIPPIEPPKDTKYIRHMRMESPLLSKFWGRPISIGIVVLVPEGFDDHPEQRYPVVFLQDHFQADFRYFSEKPSTSNGYRFYQDWTSGRLPRMLIVVTQHATPYYDDSYGVNTANAGPYGDALTQEVYPAVERRFHALGQPWARIVVGGSTGGWMTLAQQIFYPDYFGGAWGFCPDPVDFHAFQLVDVYSDKNAYYDEGPFLRLPKPLGRQRNDHVLTTMEAYSHEEAVLGTRGRSGGQMDAFHATFGPTDADGYPAKLWNAETGAVDPAIAQYWREHYDLTALLARDWERLGPKLIGKLHVTSGTKDTFYLDAAAHRMQDLLDGTKLPGKGPYYGGSFDFGNNKPHCYVGDVPEGTPWLSYYLPVFSNYIKTMAPKGADVTSWNR